MCVYMACECDMRRESEHVHSHSQCAVLVEAEHRVRAVGGESTDTDTDTGTLSMSQKAMLLSPTSAWSWHSAYAMHGSPCCARRFTSCHQMLCIGQSSSLTASLNSCTEHEHVRRQHYALRSAILHIHIHIHIQRECMHCCHTLY